MKERMDNIMSEQQQEVLLTAEAVRRRSNRERVGISIEASNAANALAWIREAERAGVEQVWMVGAGAATADILTLFAAVAARTERIRFGTAIITVYPRHPIVMAEQALALNDLAPGRLRLGIGTGYRMMIEGAFGLQHHAPHPYLKEYLEILREALREGHTDYHGKFFNVTYTLQDYFFNQQVPRRAQVPLLISAVGPKAFRLAGEISDGAISWAAPVPYLLNQALPELRAGAEARQRPVPPLIAHIPIAMSTDEAAVLEATRPLLRRALQLGYYAQMFVKAGFAEAVNGDEAALDALIRAQTVMGDEATVRDRLKELLASGLDELLLQLRPIADEKKERQQLLQLVGSL